MQKKKIIFSLAILLVFIPSILIAQTPRTQIVRGLIVDAVSNTPIPGVTISAGLDSSLRTLSDQRGRFSLVIPLGRQNIRITSVGYEEKLIPEVLVTAGKEVVLNVGLTEKIATMDEVVIQSRSGRSLNNDMAVVSGTVFNPSDTRRYAGAIGDPSRMISSVAGVASASDTRNDIVVRGNSPAGLLWQMDGINIPNPNHYGSLSSTGGPVSMLNPNNLEKSDFITGAFPAQYGNALSSVFDLRLRNGNAEKTELVGEISFSGFEAGIEGPFSKKSDASYIFNYRYSTVGVLNTIGFNVGTGTAVPQYQDVNFKVFIPLSEKNKLSVWGLGGPSKINFLGNEEDTVKNENLYGNENENLYTKYFSGVLGANLETNFNAKTYGKLSLGVARSTEDLKNDSISIVTREAFPAWESNYKTNRYQAAYLITHKFNAKNNIVAGANATIYQFQLFNKRIYGDNAYSIVRINQNERTALVQAFAQWKHRFNEAFSFSGGLHYQQLTLNQSAALEPRASLQYRFSNGHLLSIGYGMHSQMQNPTVYFSQIPINGQIVYTNKDLDFTKAQHFVLGYSGKLTPSVVFKTELYYQLLDKVPVTHYPSGFSMLNEGAYFAGTLRDSLVNNGTGSNYGVELTVEKYFSNRYYFLATGSLFESKYKGSDGVQRNTAFNTNYIGNLLAGRDFLVGKNQNTLSLNFKVTTVGGKYTSPIDIAVSDLSGETVYDEMVAPFSLRQSAYFRADLKIGYRKNYKKSTLEAGIDLQNFTNHKNLFTQTYNRRTKAIQNQYQQGFLPVPYFRLTF